MHITPGALSKQIKRMRAHQHELESDLTVALVRRNNRATAEELAEDIKQPVELVEDVLADSQYFNQAVKKIDGRTRKIYWMA